MRSALLLVSLLFVLQLSAQADKYKMKARVSPAKELSDGLLPVAVVGNDRGFIVLKLRDPKLDEKSAAKASPMMELYDRQKLQLVRTLPPTEKHGKQAVRLHDLQPLQGTPMIFGTIEPGDGSVTVVTAIVDENLTRASPPFEEIAKYNTGMKGGHVKWGMGPDRTDRFAFAASPAGDRILIASPERRDTVSNSGVHLLAMMVADRKAVWQHVAAIEAGVHRSELVDLHVDEAGNGWVLLRYLYAKKDAAKGEIEKELKLFHVSEEGIRGIRFGLDRSQYVLSAQIERTKKGAVVAGILSTTEDVTDRVRYFTAPLPTTAADIEGANVFLGPVPEGSDVRPPALEMSAVLVSDAGEIFLVAEEYEYTSVPHPKTLVHSMQHVHGNVHVVALDKSGNEKWTKSYQRLVHGNDAYVGSPLAFVFEDQFSLVAIDSEELEAKRGTDKAFLSTDMKKPYTVHVRFIEGEEKVKAKTILTNTTSPLIAGDRPYPLGKNVYVVFATSKLEKGGYLPGDIEFSR